MGISKSGIAWSLLKGFVNPFGSAVSSVISYVLEAVRAAGNAAMSAIPAEKQDKVKKWLGVSKQALGWLMKLQPFVPAKWQVEFKETVEAVETVVDSCEDLSLTEDEMAKIEQECREAIYSWEQD